MSCVRMDFDIRFVVSRATVNPLHVPPVNTWNRVNVRTRDQTDMNGGTGRRRALQAAHVLLSSRGGTLDVLVCPSEKSLGHPRGSSSPSPRVSMTIQSRP